MVRRAADAEVHELAAAYAPAVVAAAVPRAEALARDLDCRGPHAAAADVEHAVAAGLAVQFAGNGGTER